MIKIFWEATHELLEEKINTFIKKGVTRFSDPKCKIDIKFIMSNDGNITSWVGVVEF